MKTRSSSLYFLCSLFIVAIIAASCGDDEPNEPSNELIGIWNLTSLSYTNCTDPSDVGVETGLCLPDDCISWEFKENGILTATDTFDGDVEVVNGTYSINGNLLTVSLDDDTNTGGYSLISGLLTYEIQDDVIGCQIGATFNPAN